MKITNILIISTIALLLINCVQKAYERKVTFLLHTEQLKNIEKVGLRGKEKPLSWRQDLEMKAIKQDSLYSVTVTFLTGYKFTEVKFVVNDEFELQEKDNRRVIFNENGKTIYETTFDKE
ncbi:hypothetical protein GCM10011514_33170 [Emticicia aquatilis]|uniref:Uncharacterized protein n=1 Tax=Emticicia aquatilis TaxID=1537369 RepID=A0A916YY38_9BACT|nr:hypothetical protein [Emticicia aquatilis]GGD66528.1 hypothetical protein GCM10011514_33170 [Emticicia aquatilis]